MLCFEGFKDIKYDILNSRRVNFSLVTKPDTISDEFFRTCVLVNVEFVDMWAPRFFEMG